MRKIIFIAIFSAFLANAHELSLSLAVESLAKSKKIEVTRRQGKGFDSYEDSGDGTAWSWINYDFKGSSKNVETYIKSLVEAYNKDFELPTVVDARYQENCVLNMNVTYSHTGASIPVGVMNVPNASGFYVLNDTGSDYDIIYAAKWWGNPQADSIFGSVCAVKRNSVLSRNMRKSNMEESVNVSNALKRMAFLCEKFIELSDDSSALYIAQALIYPAGVIMANGSVGDKSLALEFIDRMLVSAANDRHSNGRPFSTVILSEKSQAADILINLSKSFNAPVPVSLIPHSPASFYINGSVDAGLSEVGYFVYKNVDINNPSSAKSDFVAVDGNVFEYSADIDEVCLGRVQAIFSDGSISPAWMEFLFVPGERANLFVHDGHFSLSGSEFYTQWQMAEAAFGSVSSDDVFALAKEHVDSPAYMCYVFSNNLLSSQKLKKLYDMMPKSLKTGVYGKFLDQYR